ncbi:MAG: hypothetical protein IT435_05115 [Phycisphaerales bacterium]|nr:hypothetical protein [Phycisphaerales bacterium]
MRCALLSNFAAYALVVCGAFAGVNGQTVVAGTQGHALDAIIQRETLGQF